jgi:hypothetical protein
VGVFVRRDETRPVPAKHGAGVGDRGERDVAAGHARPALGGPEQDLGVLRLVPEVGLEQELALEIGEVGGEQPALALGVVAGRSRSLERREVVADTRPECVIGACALLCGPQGGSGGEGGRYHRAFAIDLGERAAVEPDCRERNGSLGRGDVAPYPGEGPGSGPAAATRRRGP